MGGGWVPLATVEHLLPPRPTHSAPQPRPPSRVYRLPRSKDGILDMQRTGRRVVATASAVVEETLSEDRSEARQQMAHLRTK